MSQFPSTINSQKSRWRDFWREGAQKGQVQSSPEWDLSSLTSLSPVSMLLPQLWLWTSYPTSLVTKSSFVKPSALSLTCTSPALFSLSVLELGSHDVVQVALNFIYSTGWPGAWEILTPAFHIAGIIDLYQQFWLFFGYVPGWAKALCL